MPGRAAHTKGHKQGVKQPRLRGWQPEPAEIHAGVFVRGVGFVAGQRIFTKQVLVRQFQRASQLAKGRAPYFRSVFAQHGVQSLSRQSRRLCKFCIGIPSRRNQASQLS